MKYLKPFLNESINEQRCKLVNHSDILEFFRGRKYAEVKKNEFEYIQNLFKDYHSYNRNRYVELITMDDEEDQIILNKYEDEYWLGEIHYSNGPTHYYIIDGIDAIKELKL